MPDTHFDAAIAWLLRPDIEGAHADDPDDRGGDTWYGISRRAYPALAWPPSREQAIDIYRRDYWAACRCDELPPHLALLTFDAAVQHGVPTAVRLLQRTLGVVEDGDIGPRTLGAAWRFSRRGAVDFLSHRAKYYSGIVKADASQYKFARGWHRRLFLLQQHLLQGHRA